MPVPEVCSGSKGLALLLLVAVRVGSQLAAEWLVVGVPADEAVTSYLVQGRGKLH